jgi:hypothetical protein
MPADTRLGPRAEVVRGTLEMLALKLLNEEPMHGWGLSLKLREISRDVFDVNQGRLAREREQPPRPVLPRHR